jgi:hypothetical protein
MIYRIHWKLESNGRKFVSPPLLQLATQQMVASLELDEDVIDIRIEEVEDDDGLQETL